MRIECCKCKENMKHKVIDCFFFLEKMFVRIECNECGWHTDVKVYTPGVIYY